MKLTRLALPSLVVLAISGCGEPPATEQIVAERAQARWDAMVARDFEKAWEFFPPGLREETSQAVFSVEYARRPVRWDSARVIETECEPRRCETKTEVSYTVAGGPGTLAGMKNTRNVKGVWIEIDGEWWYSSD